MRILESHVYVHAVRLPVELDIKLLHLWNARQIQQDFLVSYEFRNQCVIQDVYLSIYYDVQFPW